MKRHAMVGMALFAATGLTLGVAARPSAPETAAVPAARRAIPTLYPHIVTRYPHAVDAFTEGLIWRDGALYESVGFEGRSEIRKVRLADGKILARASIPPHEFGEGLTAWKGELISLTWHDGIAHRWDVRTLRPVGIGHYAGEGWGLTSDGRSLIQSDGSASLHFLDPRTLAERRRVTVRLPDGRAVDQINELEWVEGAVFANVWHSGFVLRIDPADGRVTAIVDLRALVDEVHRTDPESVLNGIAYDPVGKRLFVTGKLWPTVFQIRLNGATR